MFEELVSPNASGFLEKFVLFLTAEFECRQGLGGADASLTISYHLQRALNVGQELELDFIATFQQD